MAVGAQNIQFNSISQFYEKVGQRRVWRWGELDMMTCVYVGPTILALSFKPQVESAHPQYPLMFCTDSQITNEAALVSEVQVTYQGIILTGGSIPYRTDPIITVTPVQGSRDFEQAWAGMISAPKTVVTSTGAAGQATGYYTYPATFNVGTQRVNVRYIGSSVTVRYHMIPEPLFATANYRSEGLSRVEFQVLSIFYGEVSVIASGVADSQISTVIQNMNLITRIPPLFPAYMGMRYIQKGKWYDVEETYAPTF